MEHGNCETVPVSRLRPSAGMLRAMTRRGVKKPNIAIVGAGSLGSALATSLDKAGYRVAEIVARAKPASRRRAQSLAKRVGARVLTIGKDSIQSDVIWLLVPDREIRRSAEVLSHSGEWKGKVVFHSSGALSSGELRALQRRGAAVASAHPMMTFVAGVVPNLAAVPFAIEGDVVAMKVARRIVKNLGGEALEIHERHKPAYHAWGAFASPLLLSLWVTAERAAELAGIPRNEARRRMLPIIRQTLANYATRGPDHAFSGPIIRGDAATLEKNLKALRRLPEVRNVYLALARSAISSLLAKNRTKLRRALR
jgi:predicted short-subunit dehydrogenase-like oxidoreductase (DUF2520 family)